MTLFNWTPAFAGVTVWEKRRLRRKLAKIPLLLAQDLEILASALRAGSSFIQAVQVTAKEGEGPLIEEWNILIKEMQMGASLPQALAHMEARLPSPPIKSLVSIVTIIQETGGNLAGVLLTLSGTLRQEITFQGKLEAMTAQGKMSGYIMSAVPFLMGGAMAFIAPDMMRPLFATAVGWIMVVGVIVLVATGSFVIKKIVAIEV